MSKESRERYAKRKALLIELIGDSEEDPGREKLMREFNTWNMGTPWGAINYLVAAKNDAIDWEARG